MKQRMTKIKWFVWPACHPYVIVSSSCVAVFRVWNSYGSGEWVLMFEFNGKSKPIETPVPVHSSVTSSVYES